MTRPKIISIATLAGIAFLVASTLSLKPRDVRPGSIILLEHEPLVQYRVIRWEPNTFGWEVVPKVGPGEHKVIRPDDVFSIVSK